MRVLSILSDVVDRVTPTAADTGAVPCERTSFDGGAVCTNHPVSVKPTFRNVAGLIVGSSGRFSRESVLVRQLSAKEAEGRA